jgi:hypothetical protein
MIVEFIRPHRMSMMIMIMLLCVREVPGHGHFI